MTRCDNDWNRMRFLSYSSLPQHCVNRREYGSICAISRQESYMFTLEQRDHVRNRVLELAQADPRVTAGALTGSMALGAGDEWSDIDIAFGIVDGITPEVVLNDWTEGFDREFKLLDHFDLR